MHTHNHAVLTTTTTTATHAARACTHTHGMHALPRNSTSDDLLGPRSYFAQPTRYGCEPPPGATGLARSSDGLHWERGTEVAMMDTYPARGAQPWEQNQIYAPYLLVHDGVVYDFCK